MTPKLQRRVHEVHPEICFWEMNGGPMKDKKKSEQGRTDRFRALAPFFPGIRGQALTEKPPGVGMDDLLDAYAAAWTAVRIANGKAKNIPDHPARDTKRLRMEIWY